MLDYTLAVLTHGRSRTLDMTIRSFMTKVKPTPTRIIVHIDGGDAAHVPALMGAERFIDSEQRGFCHATGRLWGWASHPSDDVPEFTFWLEHDFVFLRPVDLQPLAYALSEDASLAQMQLMRTPVSREEIAAGGLYEMRRADYEQRHWFPTSLETAEVSEAYPYLHHRAYFTTNPSLMRTEWMGFNQWPTDDEPFCEGRFGLDLVERGFSFGVWGCGEPWVEHIGRRDGTGY